MSEETKNIALAKAKSLKTSIQKVNLVLKSIRGKKAENALNILAFSNKRISNEIIKVLKSAIANAENNHQLDIDKLFVKEATAGKSMTLKRFRPRARGRSGKILKPYSKIKILVQEASELKKTDEKKTNEKQIKANRYSLITVKESLQNTSKTVLNSPPKHLQNSTKISRRIKQLCFFMFERKLNKTCGLVTLSSENIINPSVFNIPEQKQQKQLLFNMFEQKNTGSLGCWMKRGLKTILHIGSLTNGSLKESFA